MISYSIICSYSREETGKAGKNNASLPILATHTRHAGMYKIHAYGYMLLQSLLIYI